MQRLCSECGEPIGAKRLQAMPDAVECFECANRSNRTCLVAAPRKMLASRPIVTTFHLKRYLANVGRKTDRQSVFRTLVRLSYLFPQISPAEMTPVLVQWCKQTQSPFTPAQVTQLVLDARQWADEHPNK